MQPTITISGVTFTFNDGDVEEVETIINTELDYEAMPMSAATNAMLYDFNGVTKNIRLTGVLTDTGENTLSTGSAISIDEQRQWLEKNINGFQNTIIFQSTYGSSFNGSSFVDSRCYKANIRFLEKTGEPNRCVFSMTLLVGGV